MSKEATKEYIVRMRVRYMAMKSKKAKGRILDEFCATSELERKHAIKVLRSSSDPLRRSGRKATYGPDLSKALGLIWPAASQPCTKRMYPMMGSYVSSYEKQRGLFSPEIRKQLLKVSASSMDRLLEHTRVSSPPRRRSPAGLAAIKKEVPVRAGEWNVAEPGWVEADTVAHCGGNMGGNFAWSLTLTDILTEWTEVRVMWNRGAFATFERIREIEQKVPFILRGFDSDNGPEFMNGHLLRYFQDSVPPVLFTRSRPYHKNDNAHVEQKNGTHVRGLLGYDRIEDPECVEDLNKAVEQWSLWKNLYSPVMKLVSKEQVGKRYVKRYDKPRTPAQRILESPDISKKHKDDVRHALATTDCFSLKQQVDQSLRVVFAALRERQQAEPASPFPDSETSALPAAPAGDGLLTRKGRKYLPRKRLQVSKDKEEIRKMYGVMILTQHLFLLRNISVSVLFDATGYAHPVFTHPVRSCPALHSVWLHPCVPGFSACRGKYRE